jgi:hypothetical protein
VPRRSSASLAIAPISVAAQRLPPPAGMGEPEKAVFVDIVLALRTGHFEPSDLPLLCRYCEAAALAEQAAAAIREKGAVVGQGDRS